MEENYNRVAEDLKDCRESAVEVNYAKLLDILFEYDKLNTDGYLDVEELAFYLEDKVMVI